MEAVIDLTSNPIDVNLFDFVLSFYFIFQNVIQRYKSVNLDRVLSLSVSMLRAIYFA